MPSRLHPIDLPLQTAVTVSKPGGWIIPKKDRTTQVPVAPVLDPVPDQSDQVNIPIDAFLGVQFLDQGTPPLSWSATGLPDGITIAPASGTMTGTPTVVDTFNCVLTATNAQGFDSQPFDWVITGEAPQLNPFPNQFNVVDSPIAPVDATTALAAGTPPITWTALDLPTGITLDPNTGIFSGTPTVVNTFNCTLTATNAQGFDTVPFNWTIGAVPTAPVLNTIPPQEDEVSTPVTFDVAVFLASGTSPITWTATDIPTGMTLDPDSGIFNGTPNTVGVFNTEVTATNAQGFDTDTFVWEITAVVPLLESPLPALQSVVDEVTGPFNGNTVLIAGTPPITWGATNLPTGITIDPNTGFATGTPTVVGTFNCTLTATNAEGFDTEPFVWEIVSLNLIPVLQVPLDDYSTEVDLPIAGLNATSQLLQGTAPITWTATGLPAGITLNALTGLYSGTPTVIAVNQCTLTATNVVGFDTESFEWTVTASATIGVGLAAQADVNTRGRADDLPYDHQQAELANFTGTPATEAGDGGFIAMVFSGSQYAAFTPPITPLPNEYTLAARCSWSTAIGDMTVAGFASTVSTAPITRLEANTSNVGSPGDIDGFTRDNLGNQVNPFSSGEAIDDGLEHVLALTRSSGVMFLYIDGVQVATAVNAGLSDLTETGLNWGAAVRASVGEFFTGNVFWSGFWSRVLTAGELEELSAQPNPFVPVLRTA